MEPHEVAAGSSLGEQVPAAFDNLARVLAACGGSIQDVVSLRIYVVDRAGADLRPVGDELRRRCDRPPAATWLRVSGLADPSMLVEVEATAVIP